MSSRHQYFRIIELARSQDFIETDDFTAETLKHLSGAAADKKDRSLRMIIRRELINNQGEQHAAV